MTDAPLSPEQVAEIRELVSAHRATDPGSSGKGLELLANAAENTDALCATVEHLRAELERAEGALRGMMEGTSCRLDHHGLCQAHGWTEDGDCPEKIARDALNRMEAEDE